MSRVKLEFWIHDCTPSVAMPRYVSWNFAEERGARISKKNVMVKTECKAIMVRSTDGGVAALS